MVVATLSNHKSTVHKYPDGIPRALSGEVGLLITSEAIRA